MGSLIERKKKIMMMQGQRLLPPEYRKIEWLQSSGTQCLITDFVPSSQNLSVKWRWLNAGYWNGDHIICGSTGNNTAFYIELYSNYSSSSPGRWYCGCKPSKFASVLHNYGCELNHIYDGHMDTDYLTINGSSIARTGTYSGTEIGKFGIFCWCKLNGEAQYKHSNLRLYYITISDNGNTVANFVPCVRKSDNEPGMYDTVAQKFYSNAGTGSFIIPQ